MFEDAGYATLAPGWPDDPNTVDEANAHPEVFAHKTVGQIADHFEEVIGQLTKKPAIDRALVRRAARPDPRRAAALSAATVAIDPAPFRGVLPLPISALKSASPVLGNPANHGRAVPLTYEQFRYAFANAVSEDEAQELYNTYAVPASGVPLFQAATANLNPWTEVKVKSKNPDRGPLLIIDGEKDHTVPWAIANASYKKQKRNKGVTEIVKVAGPRPLAHDRPRLARGRRHSRSTSSSASSSPCHAPRSAQGGVQRDGGVVERGADELAGTEEHRLGVGERLERERPHERRRVAVGLDDPVLQQRLEQGRRRLVDPIGPTTRLVPGEDRLPVPDATDPDRPPGADPRRPGTLVGAVLDPREPRPCRRVGGDRREHRFGRCRDRLAVLKAVGRGPGELEPDPRSGWTGSVTRIERACGCRVARG